MILDRRGREQEQVLNEKIKELAFKRNITFAEARKLISAGQSFLK